MPSRCLVTGCTSGYDSNPKKLHFFYVPKDAYLQQLWQQALKRTVPLKFRQPVCEKHFLPSEIVWQRELIGGDGTVLGVSDRYKIPKLQKGAIPSQFPWTDNEKNVEDKPQMPGIMSYELQAVVPYSTLREPDHPDDPNVPGEPNNPDEPNKPDKSNKPDEPSKSNESNRFDKPNKPHELKELEKPRFTLEILYDYEDICVPIQWIKHKTCFKGIKFLIFYTTTCCDFNGDKDRFGIFILKELIVTENLNFKFNVTGQPVDLSSFTQLNCTYLKNIKHLEDMLLLFDSLNVCSGAHRTPKELQQINCNFIYQDRVGTWRHKNCSLLLQNSTKCPACVNGKKVYSQKLCRLINRMTPEKIHSIRFTRKRRKSSLLRQVSHTGENIVKKENIDTEDLD